MYMPFPPRTQGEQGYGEIDGFQWFAWRHPDLDRVALFLNLNEVRYAWANHITAEGEYVSATFLYPVINRPLAEQHVTLAFPFNMVNPFTWTVVLHRKGIKVNETDKYPASGDVTITGTIPPALYNTVADLVAAANNSRPVEYRTEHTIQFEAEGLSIVHLYYYADLPEAVTEGLPAIANWTAVAAVDNSAYQFLDPDTIGIGPIRPDDTRLAGWNLLPDPEV
jgi:hypothetical protein